MKTLIDRFGKTIQKGTVVRYKFEDSWMRVTKVNPKQKTVNLGGIFSGVIHYKSVPIDAIYEDDAAWFEHWQKSEAYQSM